MPTKKKAGTVKVKLINSPIGKPRTQRAVLESLGLRKLNRTREYPDNPAVRGMIAKVHHLVQVL